MPHVLVVATNDDEHTVPTHGWANDLLTALASQGHTYQLIDGAGVNAANLAATIAGAKPPVDYVVFYGHAEPHRLCGQRDGSFPANGPWPTLVDDTTVAVLRGARAYVVACDALQKLGAAYGVAYPAGAFLGYEQRFGYSSYDAADFRDIANKWAATFAGGGEAGQVEAGLRREWQDLNRDYWTGARPFKDLGAPLAAGLNAKAVGRRPP